MEAGVVGVLVILLAVVGWHWEVMARLTAWSATHPWLPVDDLVLLLALSHLSVTAFGARLGRDLKREVARNKYAAEHDALTGLPNRVVFSDRLRVSLTSSARQGALSAVLLIDLNEFKRINDTIGHHAGDLALQQVAQRLVAVAHKTETVTRLGGDEFAIVLSDLSDLASVDRAAVRFQSAFIKPVAVAGVEFTITPSIGVAVQGRDGDEADQLHSKADAAMYAAKRLGGGIAHYDAVRDEAAARVVALVQLRTAIEQGQLRLHYQPSVRLHDGVVTGAEALVRWQHPTRGLLAPDQFIPLAEQSDLINPLAAWVIEEAARQCEQWVEDGLDLWVAVNLSARNVVDDRLPLMVRDALVRHHLSADRLVFEVTETALIDRPEDASRILTELSDIGVNIAVDDFGTGYATLAWLQILPFSALKIDRTFVADLATDRPGAELARYTTQLAHAMGKVVVAEGVESAGQWIALDQMGCDHAQGFGISRPLPTDDFATWLRTWQSQADVVIGHQQVPRLRAAS